jgi:hypothetical protein
VTEHPGEQFQPDVDPDVEPGFDPGPVRGARDPPGLRHEPGAKTLPSLRSTWIRRGGVRPGVRAATGQEYEHSFEAESAGTR